MRITIPTYVQEVLDALITAGFEAYVVGGAVRDALLGRKPDDYDVVTNARPDEIKLLVQHTNLTIAGAVGEAFGVILLSVGRRTVEVASYRNETYGDDSHRPAEVWYCDRLDEDLGRRDFTINSMALSADGTLIDMYGGLDDLHNKCLRTVGNAEKRFEEDALRMFRACRFIAQLSFKPDPKIKKAIIRNLDRVQGLSVERVRVELDKMLCGAYAAQGLALMVETELNKETCRQRINGQKVAIPILPELSQLVGVEQNPLYHKYPVWEHTLVAVSKGDRSLEVEWALLLHDVAKGTEGIRGYNADGTPNDHGHEVKSALMAEVILGRLGYPKAVINRVVWLVRNHMRFGANMAREDSTTWKWLRKTAREGPFRITKEMAEGFKQLVAVCIADLAACNVHEQELISAQSYGKKLIVMAYEMPIHTSDLNVSGADVAKIIADKASLGDYMQIMLQRVQDGTLENKEGALLTAANAWEERR
ncbi:MAG: CCA tRNA nucleotidyltransferase [Acidaminococcaceae bacterium]|nr:CCA tRNA nucleotidyltransferase [Acidaminococcaceae bacterium]